MKHLGIIFDTLNSAFIIFFKKAGFKDIEIHPTTGFWSMWPIENKLPNQQISTRPKIHTKNYQTDTYSLLVHKPNYRSISWQNLARRKWNSRIFCNRIKTMSIRKATFFRHSLDNCGLAIARISTVAANSIAGASTPLPADFGLIAMAGVAPGIAAMLADLGLSSALMHFSTPDHPTFSTLYWLNLGLGCF